MENRAGSKLFAYLKDTSEIFDLKSKFRDFHKRITYIQQKYRERVSSLKSRMDFLKEYFDREKQFLVGFYINKKTKKNSKTLVRKLNLIHDNVRDRILKIYMEKCTMEYNIKFNKWRININDDSSGVDMEAFLARSEMLR